MTENKRLYDVINKAEPRGQSVTYEGIPCTARHCCTVLNRLTEENEQLKQSVSNLKDTIIKITIAYHRKYDRTIVDLVDEVHEENITDLIKELQE